MWPHARRESESGRLPDEGGPISKTPCPLSFRSNFLDAAGVSMARAKLLGDVPQGPALARIRTRPRPSTFWSACLHDGPNEVSYKHAYIRASRAHRVGGVPARARSLPERRRRGYVARCRRNACRNGGHIFHIRIVEPAARCVPAAEDIEHLETIKAAGRFCVNVLASDQEAVCRALAAKGGDKFADVAWREAPSRSPIIEGTIAWIDCRIEAMHDAGDHWLIIGRVLDLRVDERRCLCCSSRAATGALPRGRSRPSVPPISSSTCDSLIDCGPA